MTIPPRKKLPPEVMEQIANVERLLGERSLPASQPLWLPQPVPQWMETDLTPYYRAMEAELKALGKQTGVPLRLLRRPTRRRDRIWASFQACRRFLWRRLGR